jgi:hypothetical protein
MSSAKTTPRVGWPSRPRRLRHHSLGKFQRWQHESGFVRVDRYLETSGRFLAQFCDPAAPPLWSLISAHRTLGAAKSACVAFLKRAGL